MSGLKVGRRNLETHARRAAVGTWLCALALIGGCGSKDPEGDTNVVIPMATVPDAGPAVTTVPDSGRPAPLVPVDAGSLPVAPVDSGVVTPVIPVVPAGDAGDAGAAGDASTGGEGGVPTGPLALPEPDKAGPYAVKELDNVGMGFENPIDASDQGTGGIFCTIFVSAFTTDQMEIDAFANVPAAYKMDLYTLYYPEGAPGQRFPVLSWANGTCAHTVGYADMIKHVVSHGFIVIAPHSRFTGSGLAQKRGIDWVLMQDTVANSPLFGRVNKDLVGVFGHSQGGGSTGNASGDPRVKTSVLMHGGSGSMLHAPGLFLTGDGDLNPAGVRSAYDAARGPTAFGSLKMSNHITMMNGKGHERMAPEVAAWFRYTLLKDEVAKKWFVGTDCVLCRDSEWVYAQKMLQ